MSDEENAFLFWLFHVLQKERDDRSTFLMALCTRVEMFHRHTGLKILFLLASSQVAFSQFPLPLIYLDMSSDRLTEGESLKISCVAPRAYAGAYFYLFMVGQTQPVQMLPAPENQHQVAFLLENVTTSNTGLYRCQYGVLNGSQLQPSALSYTVEITVEAFSLSTFPPPTSPPGSDCQDPSWILLTALGVTGVLLLVTTLLVAVMAFGRFKERRQKKKKLDSCWTEGRCSATELSFDNCVFTVTPKREQETAERQDAQIFSPKSFRLASDSDPGQPDFFTFRTSQ